MEEPGFYRPFEQSHFTNNECFLCGEKLQKENRSDEHIFPKWLQKRFNLWNQSLTVLNRTKIPYRHLTIPCCTECNGNHLSKMENKFRSLLDSNFENLTEKDEKVIFQWTSKLLYGTLYKELTLLNDRSKPSLGNILTPDFVESYSALHLFLQSIRIPTEFEDPKPWSIFIFNYHDNGFDYINDINALCVSLKLGDIGISIVFEDNSCVEGFMKKLKGLRCFKLNHLQFLEVSAHIFYTKHLAANVPTYLTVYNTERKIMQTRTFRNITSRKWNDAEYASVLEQLLGFKNIKEGLPILNEDGLLTTYLVGDDGIPFLHKLRDN